MNTKWDQFLKMVEHLLLVSPAGSNAATAGYGMIVEAMHEYEKGLRKFSEIGFRGKTSLEKFQRLLEIHEKFSPRALILERQTVLFWGMMAHEEEDRQILLPSAVFGVSGLSLTSLIENILESPRTTKIDLALCMSDADGYLKAVEQVLLKPLFDARRDYRRSMENAN